MMTAYHMAIYGDTSKRIREEYTYVWTNEEL